MSMREIHDAVNQFYGREAMLLDTGRYDEWLTLLDPAIEYRVPIRLGTDRRETQYPAGAYRQLDDYLTLSLRVERAKSELGYSEAPPSRTLRSVSSICICEDGAETVTVSSALIVYRNRANDMHGDTIHARRDDTLVKTAEGLKLASRTVLLTDVSLGTPNLGIFL